MKESFIFDLPTNPEKEVSSAVILDETIVKSLSLGNHLVLNNYEGGILKSFERDDLKLDLILVGKVPKQLE